MRILRVISSVAVCLLFGAEVRALPTGLDDNGHLVQVVPAGSEKFAFAELEAGVQFRVGEVTKSLLFYGPATVRVTANLGTGFWQHPSIVVLGRPGSVKLRITDEAERLIVASERLRLTIDKSTGAVSFHDSAGWLFTRERADRPEQIKKVEISGGTTYEVHNTFALKQDEGIYGFGFVNQGQTNRRGQELNLIQTNVGIVIPMMLSSERYGVMWDTYSVMRFKDDAQGATLWAESAPGGVDYYFMGGESLDDVIHQYRELTGHAPMLPKQAFGLFMSKERYATQQRIVEVANTFRAKRFPLDYIVQDWQYWGSDKDGTWSGMIWDPQRYPDPQAMTSAIHDLHLKLMISIWPSVGNDTALAQELDQYGLRFEPLHWISKKARVYDAFSEKGREIYFKHIKQGLLDKGVDALWMDGTEVEVGTACWNPAEVARDIKALGRNAMGDFSRYLNPYTLMTTRGTYEGQRATGNRRVLTLTRSAWAGAQRYAAVSWSGDIFASWRTLQEQVSGGVNVAMAGNPYWTQDTGGFFVKEFPGGENNAAYQELFARWFQYAAFNPIMRIHGTNIEREPYVFAEKNPQMYASLERAVQLRYRLLPYIYSLSWRVTNDGYTLMRGLVMDFPDDRTVRNINDEFMFGPSLLVQPVTRAMYNVAEPPPPTVPAIALHTPAGESGLSVQYFQGTNFEKPMGTVVDAVVDHTWPGPPLAGPPAGLADFNDFSARWQGTLTAPEEGEYEIGVEYDDGARLILGDKRVVDDWTFGPKRYKGAKVHLAAGEAMPVTIEYHQGRLDRALRLAWRTPAHARELAERKAGLNTTMRTYLPAGAAWYDFWTNQRFTGGEVVSTEAPLDSFPLFVRSGSIVPMGPAMQYATELPDAGYEIRIYPGADVTFTIYEDDNETYDYEKGERATYELKWNDAEKMLNISARAGTFPGMTMSRRLDIRLASPEAATGASGEPWILRTVEYTGKAIQVRFE